LPTTLPSGIIPPVVAAVAAVVPVVAHHEVVAVGNDEGTLQAAAPGM
jgi:hypothetical protein